MYCKKCGKDIGESYFCPHCGEPSNKQIEDENAQVRIEAPTSSINMRRSINHKKSITIIAWLATAINLVIRFLYTEIEVVYILFASDDYYIVSEEGKKWMLFIAAVQIILSILICYDARKNKIKISAGSICCAVLLLIVQIVAMVLRIPAFY